MQTTPTPTAASASACPRTRSRGRCPFSHRQAPSLPAPPPVAATPVCALLSTLDDCLDPVTGLLPRRTPVAALPGPFGAISRACAALPGHYHADGADVRPWLDELFGDARDWQGDVDGLDEHTTESAMTQVSLLCHAYRWQSAPTPAASYRIDRIELPAGLAGVWGALAARLGVPRVGVFYTMVCNNWRLAGKGDGEAYDPNELTPDAFEVMYPWLRGESAAELRAFILAAIGIEALGAAMHPVLADLYRGIQRGHTAAVTGALVALQSVLRQVESRFNQQIRVQRIRPQSFLTLIQPTMIWLLDEGDGPLEGASGPQSCLIQLVDSVLGVPRDSELGGMLLAARKYMLPAHRRLLEAFDGATDVVRAFVASSGDARLRDAYDECLALLQRWRRSHRARGALYIRGDAENPVEDYASTGLVVGLDTDRVATFEAAMDQHIAETHACRMADPTRDQKHCA